MAEPNGKLVTPTGFNPSGVLRALELDASDFLKVAIAAYVAGMLTEVAGKDAGAVVRELLVSTTGRVLVDPGGADKLFAFDSGYALASAFTLMAAGANVINITAIPANKVCILTNLGIQYDGVVANVIIEVGQVVGGAYSVFYRQKPPVSAIIYDRQGWWPLAAGSNIQMNIAGATAGDHAIVYTTGFLMDAT